MSPRDFEREIRILKAYLQVSPADIEALQNLLPLLAHHVPRIVTEFYDHLVQFPQLEEILQKVDISNLKEILSRYLLSLSDGKFDRDFFEHRLNVGTSHVRVGIEPRWFLGAYGFFLSALTEAVCTEKFEDPKEAAATIIALQKAIVLDVNIALDTYYEVIRRKEIEKTEKRHQEIVENATDLIWSFTTDGQITYMNRGLCGHPRDAFLKKGMSLLDALHTPASRETMGRAIARIQGTRDGVHNLESTLLNPATGRTEHFLSNLSPVTTSEGELVGIQGITRDVTEVKKLEKKILNRERLATVGRMAATVAHEIRNPLAGIRGALETLLPKFKVSEGDQAILNEILERIEALNSTVQDLLIFSRPLALDRVQISLKSFLEGTVALLREDPKLSRVEVEYEIPEEMEVLVDPQQGKLAFTNILLNSAQAMEGHGLLRITAMETEDASEIVVEDTGPGIEETVRDEIFTPFFTTKPHGTGLGLSIVRWIIEAHGGSIFLDTAETVGARFLISLPKP